MRKTGLLVPRASPQMLIRPPTVILLAICELFEKMHWLNNRKIFTGSGGYNSVTEAEVLPAFPKKLQRKKLKCWRWRP